MNAILNGRLATRRFINLLVSSPVFVRISKLLLRRNEVANYGKVRFEQNHSD